MLVTAYYNEHDPKAAAWLRELIAQGHSVHSRLIFGSRDGNRTRSLQLMRLARYRYSTLQQTDSDAEGAANAGRPTATDHIPIR